MKMETRKQSRQEREAKVTPYVHAFKLYDNTHAPSKLLLPSADFLPPETLLYSIE